MKDWIYLLGWLFCVALIVVVIGMFVVAVGGVK